MKMPYELTGTRKLINSGNVPPVIEERLCKLEEAVDSGSNDAFDHSKTLVESVCKTILLDRGVQVETNWDLPKLMKEVLTCLPLVSSSHSLARDARERLKTLQRGLEWTVQGLAEMRNLAGWSSHGPNGYMEPLDKVHIMLAAMSADTISCFLLSLHKSFSFPDDRARIYYEDYSDFNEYIDDLTGEIEILGLSMRPSEMLFMADSDHVAYREQLILYLNQEEENGLD